MDGNGTESECAGTVQDLIQRLQALLQIFPIDVAAIQKESAAFCCMRESRIGVMTHDEVNYFPKLLEISWVNGGNGLQPGLVYVT